MVASIFKGWERLPLLLILERVHCGAISKVITETIHNACGVYGDMNDIALVFK